MWALAVPIIFDAVKIAERAVRGHRRGSDKKQIALEMVQAALSALAKAGDIKAIPTAGEIAQEIDTAHAGLQALGALSQPFGQILISVSELADLLRAAKGISS